MCSRCSTTSPVATPTTPASWSRPLLNYVVLEPGESMFVDAGVIHAYGSGFALEIMASSDNVVRAGLTGKHKDVDELLAITDFTPPRAAGRWPRPRISRSPSATPPLDALPETGPRVVLVLDGEVELTTRTRAGWRRARESRSSCRTPTGRSEVHGAGRVAVGSVP